MGLLSIQEYSVQLTFRQSWLDPRLAYQNQEGGKILSTLKATLFNFPP